MKADLHIHTGYSPDCVTPLENIIARCNERGINCVGITDHNTIAGALDMKRVAPFKVVIGEEIDTKQGEVIGYYISEEIPRGLTAVETVMRIKEQGGKYSLQPLLGLRHDPRKQDLTIDVFEKRGTGVPGFPGLVTAVHETSSDVWSATTQALYRVNKDSVNSPVERVMELPPPGWRALSSTHSWLWILTESFLGCVDLASKELSPIKVREFSRGDRNSFRSNQSRLVRFPRGTVPFSLRQNWDSPQLVFPLPVTCRRSGADPAPSPPVGRPSPVWRPADPRFVRPRRFARSKILQLRNSDNRGHIEMNAYLFFARARGMKACWHEKSGGPYGT